MNSLPAAGTSRCLSRLKLQRDFYQTDDDPERLQADELFPQTRRWLFWVGLCDLWRSSPGFSEQTTEHCVNIEYRFRPLRPPQFV